MQITRFQNSIFGSNSFLIEGCLENSDAYLVDCGDVLPIAQYLSKTGKRLRTVFITHTHYDHIYGLNKLCEIFPDIQISTSLHGKEGLYSDKLNLSKYHSDSFVLLSDKIVVLEEEQKLQLTEDMMLEVYATPGHDWSSLCYRIGNNLFTGDSYLPQYDLITKFPKSDAESAYKSLERIKKLSVGCTIYPGHGDIVYI